MAYYPKALFLGEDLSSLLSFYQYEFLVYGTYPYFS